jgi:hypothetical protein
MGNIILPMKEGCMDDIVMQELTTSANTETQRERGSQASSDSVGGSSATLPNSQIVYDQEERYVFLNGNCVRSFLFNIHLLFFKNKKDCDGLL